MPRRLASGSAQDLVQAEHDIRTRIGEKHLDFAAMAAVSNIYRAARRQAHDEDGRLVLVSLEPKGEAVIERLFPAFNARETQVSGCLSEREKNQLATLLSRIIRSVEVTRPPAAAR